MTRLAALALACLLFIHGTAFAKNAEIMLLPTRVVMEKNDRQGTIVIKNTGDATGNFTIELVDMKMLETGIVVPYDAGETAQFSATSLIHIAPKSMTLKPGETQNVRLLLRKPETLEPGEYRTHLTVTNVPPADTGLTAEQAAAAGRGELVLRIQSIFGLSIPLIVRTGAVNSAATLGAIQAGDDKGKPVLDVPIRRSGVNSVYGNIEVRSGKDVVGLVRGLGVYPEVAERTARVPLNRALRKGENVTVSYLADDAKPGVAMASGRFTAP